MSEVDYWELAYGWPCRTKKELVQEFLSQLAILCECQCTGKDLSELKAENIFLFKDRFVNALNLVSEQSRVYVMNRVTEEDANAFWCDF